MKNDNEPPEIELKNGAKLVRSEGHWSLQRENRHIQFLNKFEEGLVDGAIAATVAKWKVPRINMNRLAEETARILRDVRPFAMAALRERGLDATDADVIAMGRSGEKGKEHQMLVGHFDQVSGKWTHLELSMSQEEYELATKKPLEPGDKVFVVNEKKLATVLAIYPGSENSEIRLDLCGNIGIDGIERYDAVKHAEFDDTFLPIKADWKEKYGITKDVPLREESPRRHAGP